LLNDIDRTRRSRPAGIDPVAVRVVPVAMSVVPVAMSVVPVAMSVVPVAMSVVPVAMSVVPKVVFWVLGSGICFVCFGGGYPKHTQIFG